MAIALKGSFGLLARDRHVLKSISMVGRGSSRRRPMVWAQVQCGATKRRCSEEQSRRRPMVWAQVQCGATKRRCSEEQSLSDLGDCLAVPKRSISTV
jgi:heterodisulfide reductase subunit C